MKGYSLNKSPVDSRSGDLVGVDVKHNARPGSFATAALERLKRQLLREKGKLVSDGATLARLRRAADDAASIAWTTIVPLLVLPELFDEKAAMACVQSQRQGDIRRRSRGLVTQSA